MYISTIKKPKTPWGVEQRFPQLPKRKIDFPAKQFEINLIMYPLIFGRKKVQKVVDGS